MVKKINSQGNEQLNDILGAMIADLQADGILEKRLDDDEEFAETLRKMFQEE